MSHVVLSFGPLMSAAPAVALGIPERARAHVSAILAATAAAFPHVRDCGPMVARDYVARVAMLAGIPARVGSAAAAPTDGPAFRASADLGIALHVAAGPDESTDAHAAEIGARVRAAINAPGARVSAVLSTLERF